MYERIYKYIPRELWYSQREIVRERKFIKALKRTAGAKRDYAIAAEILGISKRTFYRELKKYELEGLIDKLRAKGKKKKEG